MVDFRAYYCAALAQRESRNPYLRDLAAPMRERAAGALLSRPEKRYGSGALSALRAGALLSADVVPFAAAAVLWWLASLPLAALAAYALARIARQPVLVGVGRARALARAGLVHGRERLHARDRGDRAGRARRERSRSPSALRNRGGDDRAADRASRGARPLRRVPQRGAGSCSSLRSSPRCRLRRRRRADVRVRDVGASRACTLRGLARQPIQHLDGLGRARRARLSGGARGKHRVRDCARRSGSWRACASRAATKIAPSRARSAGVLAAGRIVRAYRRDCCGGSGLPVALYARREHRALLFAALLLLAMPWMLATSAAMFLAPLFPVAYLVYALWSGDRAAAFAAALASFATTRRALRACRTAGASRRATRTPIRRSIRASPRRVGVSSFSETPRTVRSRGCCERQPGPGCWPSHRSPSRWRPVANSFAYEVLRCRPT